jgi:hypothetical protein
MKLVCSNATYLKDPLAAISSHLNASLPAVVPAAAPDLQPVRLSKAEKKKLAIKRRVLTQLESRMDA